jgi:phage terminase large subunit-like protein
LLRGRTCFGGLDLGSTDDLSSLGLVFPPFVEDEHWYSLEYYWTPSDSVRMRTERDKVPYDRFVRDGWITTTPGNVTDYEFIRRDIVDRIAVTYSLQELAYDKHFATQLATELMEDLGTDVVIPLGQGFWLSAAIQELERLAIGRLARPGDDEVRRPLLRHSGNPVTRWMIGNVQITENSQGRVKIDKDRSKEKVDGPVALAMALDRAMLHYGQGSESIYDQRLKAGLPVLETF